MALGNGKIDQLNLVATVSFVCKAKRNQNIEAMQL